MQPIKLVCARSPCRLWSPESMSMCESAAVSLPSNTNIFLSMHFLCFCMSVCLCLSVYAHRQLCIYLCMYVSPSHFLRLSLLIYLMYVMSISLSVGLISISSSLFPSLSLSLALSVSLGASLSLSLSLICALHFRVSNLRLIFLGGYAWHAA